MDFIPDEIWIHLSTLCLAMAAGGKGIEAGRAYVKAWLDDSAVMRGAKRMAAKLKSVGTGIAGIGGMALGAGAGIAAMFWKPLQAAGEMQAALASFDTIFKDSSKAMGAWGDNLAKQLGRSKTDVRNFMTMTQGRLLAAGVDPGAANAINQQLTARAFDLAQFWDKDDETAAQAMQNALTGEMEMLKQFGIVIAAADVDAKLKAMGLDPKSATQAEKVQARFALIMDRSKETQGTAAREAGEWSSQLKRAQAVVKDTAAAIGVQLLPYATKALETFSTWGDWLQTFIGKNAQVVKYVAMAAGGLMAFGAVLTIVGTGLALMGAAITGSIALFGVLAGIVGFFLSPLGLVIGAITVGTVALFKWAEQTGRIGELLEWLKEKFGPLAEQAKAAFQVIKDALAAGELKAAGDVLMAALWLAFVKGKNKLLGLWESMTADFRTGWNQTLAGLVGTFTEWGAHAEAAARNAYAGLLRAREAFARMIGKEEMADAWQLMAESQDDIANNLRRSAGKRGEAATTGMLDDPKKEANRRLNRQVDRITEESKAAAALKKATDEATKKTAEANATDPNKKPPGDDQAGAGDDAAGRVPTKAKPAINSAIAVNTAAGQEAFLKATQGFNRITPGEKELLKAMKDQTAAVNNLAENAVVIAPGETQ